MLYCDYAILIRHSYRIDTIWHILLSPFRVASLAGGHLKFVFSYERKSSFFLVSSILNKAALGIKIRLPIRILGIVPHLICSYAVPRPIRKSFAASSGVSTSGSVQLSSLLIFFSNPYDSLLFHFRFRFPLGTVIVMTLFNSIRMLTIGAPLFSS